MTVQSISVSRGRSLPARETGRRLALLLALLPVWIACAAPAPLSFAGAGTSFDIAARAELGDDFCPTGGDSRYVVMTGGWKDPGLGDRLQRLLLSFEAAYRSLWREGLTLGQPSDRVQVYVFPSLASLRRALQRAGLTRPSFEAGGVYLREPGLLAVAQESRLERVLAASLVHEAAHFLNSEMLGLDESSPWMNEGLAQYCQYSAVGDDGEIRLGEIDAGSLLRVPQGVEEIIYQFVPRRSLSYLMGQFKRDSDLSLGPLLQIRDPDRFYGAEAQLHYAQSWTLVHLLAEGADRKRGSLRPFFFEYARLERKGKGGKEALLQTLRMSLQDLDNAWYRHVEKLW